MRRAPPPGTPSGRARFAAGAAGAGRPRRARRARRARHARRDRRRPAHSRLRAHRQRPFPAARGACARSHALRAAARRDIDAPRPGPGHDPPVRLCARCAGFGTTRSGLSATAHPVEIAIIRRGGVLGDALPSGADPRSFLALCHGRVAVVAAPAQLWSDLVRKRGGEQAERDAARAAEVAPPPSPPALCSQKAAGQRAEADRDGPALGTRSLTRRPAGSLRTRRCCTRSWCARRSTARARRRRPSRTARRLPARSRLSVPAPPRACHATPSPSLPYKSDTSRHAKPSPRSRTNRTRLVTQNPPLAPVQIGHVSSRNTLPSLPYKSDTSRHAKPSPRSRTNRTRLVTQNPPLAPVQIGHVSSRNTLPSRRAPLLHIER